ncbi:MAG: linear amide C-N hydrolase [Clostridia bacterium]|nr:linear amide C-N hydrolase [Clostridia bacterium]
MKKRIACLLLAGVMFTFSGCSDKEEPPETTSGATSTAATTTVTTTMPETTTEETTAETTTKKAVSPLNASKITATESIRTLSSGFKIAKFSGDDGLSDFLAGGGAASDDDLTNFLVREVLGGKAGPLFKGIKGGCSTLCVENTDGGYLFGRNFDWRRCNGMILVCHPSKGYKSVSTVNTDFMTSSTSYKLTDDVLRFCALYTPLDGMNEQGVCVSVNMVYDSGASINQNNGRPDLTTSTAIRLILDRASSAKQAVELLRSYDLHASFGYAVHYAIADAAGYSVAVEYIGNKMYVTETPALTNFYVTPGSKYGVGSKKSVARYNSIMAQYEENKTMTPAELRDVMASASQSNVNDYSTEWTAIFDTRAKTVTYFHRGNYNKGYVISL